jgi:hypothetical protein
MDPFVAFLYGFTLALPFHLIALRYFAVHLDPALVRERGVVILHPSALQELAAPVGEYMGREIWGSVTFKGMVYRFDHVVHRRERDRTGPRELFLEPGLLYRTD